MMLVTLMASVLESQGHRRSALPITHSYDTVAELIAACA
jgi:hypothetical protein